MFNFPIFGGLLGARSVTASFKGEDARPMAKLMARNAASKGELSDQQVRKVNDIDSLREELSKGYERVVSQTVETSRDGTVEVRETDSPIVKKRDITRVGNTDHIKRPSIEEEVSSSDSVMEFPFRKETPQSHEAKGEPQRVEPREEPKKISPAMSHFLEVFDNKEVIDLDKPKKTWPNEVKSRVKEKTWAEFTESHGNGTGYYDPITNKEFGLPIGALLKGTDAQGRKLVIIVGDPDTEYGNVVVFQRYTPDPTPQGPLVANVPDRVGKLFQVGGSALMAAELRILFGTINPVKENLYARLFAEDA